MKVPQGSNPARVRAANQAAILKAIYHGGPIKRSEIAGLLDLTLPTITTNVNAMMARGIVRETELTPAERSLGRKAHPVDIVPQSRHFLGVEIQGTRRTVCLVDYRGRVLFREADEEECRDYEKNLDLACGMIRRALDACGMDLDGISGVGVCLPGLVDSRRGILELRPSYNWRSRDVRGDLAARLGCGVPVTVENNACARAYGVQLFHRDVLEDAQTFAYLFIGRGIACPLVLNTASVFGSVVGAGEVGHMVMEQGGLRCSCGNNGCLEAYSSDSAVLGRCAGVMERGGAPVLRRLCGEGRPTMSQVLAACEEGDPQAAEIVGLAVDMLGVAVANLNNFACPSLMLIDGKLFVREENRRRLLEVVRRNLCGMTPSGTRFEFLEPDVHSGSMGAAAMAICKDLETYIEL